MHGLRTGLTSYDRDQNGNRSIDLSMHSDPIKQNTQALLLLKILSYLPAGTTIAALRWWVPALNEAKVLSAIAALSGAGYYLGNERQRQGSDSTVLFVLPIVQSFMQQRGRIEEEIWHNLHSTCCQYVLDNACRNYDPAFPTKSKALAAEDTNIEAILYGSPTMRRSIVLSDRAIEALVAFSWYHKT